MRDDPETNGDPLVGTILDRRYRLELRLAAGGFGAIYRASHVSTGREIALKVLHTKLATEPDVVARFRREGELLARLRDPHTIRAYAFGETSDGTLYIVMELLQGESLYERYCAFGPLPWHTMAAIARQVCGSLSEAHGLGIIHRDLKPTNIHLELLGGDPDFVKVLDFGIAKILHGSILDATDLTRAGHVIGTFDYMAPEQLVGGSCTGRSDIFTLGIVMYEMIAGERPFGDPQSPAQMMKNIVSRIPPLLSDISSAPVELATIVARCLDRDPQQRFAAVEPLADALDALLVGDDTSTQVTPADDDTSVTRIEPVSVDPTTTIPGIIPPRKR